ncbi:MAG: membrane protein [Silanimonas sp.]|nr:MAG: membrane protein [Silanimonas sp.]
MAEENQDIGGRLRSARLRQGLEIDALARELKYTRAILQAIEAGDWPRLGAPVFARNLVGRYAARLGVSVDLDAVAQHLHAPVLRSQVPVSRFGRFAEFSARHAAYAGGSLLVLSMVYGALSLVPSGPVQVRSLDPALDQPLAQAILAAPEAEAPAGEPAQPPADAPTALVPEEVPEHVAASAGVAPAPAASKTEAAAAPRPVAASFTGGVLPRQLEMRFSGESWIEVMRRDGSVIERVLARAGEVRRYPLAEVGRVTVGNVDATEVIVDGSRVNLDGVRAANVARFALSSDGSIEAIAR